MPHMIFYLFFSSSFLNSYLFYMAQTLFTTTVKAEDRNNDNNFISYSNMSMENKRKKTTRACLHCQKVLIKHGS